MESSSRHFLRPHTDINFSFLALTVQHMFNCGWGLENRGRGQTFLRAINIRPGFSILEVGNYESSTKKG